MNSKADFYFSKGRWQEETLLLRNIVNGCGLQEEVKWGCPCYTSDGRNIVLIHVFKEYCALLFFKGALLKDPGAVLVQQTENVQSARQMRFTEVSSIIKQRKKIVDLVKQAIQVEKSGQKVELKRTAEFRMPEEFEARLKKNRSLKKAFDALTPGRQRAYLLHFGGARQAQTREKRIDKAIPNILNGKGIND